MSTRESRRHRADRESRRMLFEIGAGLKEGRIGSGLSQLDVGSFAGLSGSEVGRLERGLIPNASLASLTRIAWATGQTLHVRLYPGPDPLRDAGHVRLLERFRVRIDEAFRWRTEVPLHGSPGLSAWDALLESRDDRTAVEAETRIRDGQALGRRLALKLRADATVDRLILLVADTVTNRSALASLRPALRDAFPLDTRQVLQALASGRHPDASGIVVL